MFFLAVDFDPFAAGADEVFERRVQVERVAHLVKVSHLQIRTLTNFPGRRGHIGLQFAQNKLEQCAFSGAIGAEQADLVAAYQSRAETVDDDFFKARMTKAFRHVREFGHDLAAFVAAGNIQVDAAHRVAPGCTVVTQGFQAANAGRAAGAARFHPFTNPDFFLRQQFVRLGEDDGFLCHLVFFLNQVLGKVAGVTAQLAAIQLNNDVRHLIQKSPVMGNGDDAAVEIDQQFFQPGNRVQIQVIGRLVKQQHIGLGNQRLR